MGQRARLSAVFASSYSQMMVSRIRCLRHFNVCALGSLQISNKRSNHYEKLPMKYSTVSQNVDNTRLNDNKQKESVKSEPVQLFIEGLQAGVTNESLTSYFSKLAQVTDCNVYSSPYEGVNSIAFVTFSSQAECDKAIDVKKKHKSLVQVCPLFEHTLIVGNLARETTDQSLKEFFSKFGSVLKAEVLADQFTGETSGIALVTFSSAQEAAKAIECQPHQMDDKLLCLEHKNENQIFVTGLAQETNEYSLASYFQQFGPITECSVVLGRESSARTDHCFVNFASKESCLEVLKRRPHVIDGKRVHIQGNKFAGREHILFVGSLSHATTEQSLRRHFGRFGSICMCELPELNRETGKPRGFAHVSYLKREEAQAAIDEQWHVIDNKVVDVRWHGILKKELSVGAPSNFKRKKN